MAKSRHYRTEEKKNNNRRVREVIIRQRTGSDYYDEHSEDTSPERINVYADEDTDYDDFDGNYGNRRRYNREERKKRKRRRLIVIFSCVALALVISLAATKGQTFSILYSKFKVALVGTGTGDGFPVEITGNNVSSRGFAVTDYGCVTLSDTALTAVNSTGKNIFTVRHSFSSPMMSERNGSFIIYDCGSYAYTLVDSSGNYEKRTSDYKIISADIAENGNYVLVTIPDDYASQAEVYDSDGNLKYTYKFAEDYASAAAINPEGNMCAVSVLYTRNAELYSRVVILSIKSEAAEAEYIYKGCMVTDVFWKGSSIYCIGDEGLLAGTSDGYFYEYSFAGKNITAVYCDDDRCFVSVSSYTHGGDSDLLVFSGANEPLDIYSEERITSITSSGSLVSCLAGEMISCYSASSGDLKSTADTGYDSRAVAQADSSTVYVLGAQEIRSAVLVD